MHFLYSIIFIGFLLCSATSIAGSPWDADLKEKYEDQCEIAVRNNPMVQDHKYYCSCYTDGLEEEYGKEGYYRVIKTTPDENGNAMAQFMAALVMACAIGSAGQN